MAGRFFLFVVGMMLSSSGGKFKRGDLLTQEGAYVKLKLHLKGIWLVIAVARNKGEK